MEKAHEIKPVNPTARKANMKIKVKVIWSHLSLETEDCDQETDCCCDAQTHHHRLGVIEAIHKVTRKHNLLKMLQEFLTEYTTQFYIGLH